MRNSLPTTLNDSDIRQQKKMRKIMATDIFPCFACFDDENVKLNCIKCLGNGYIMGSHPMVQFAQDFIQKKMAKICYNNKSQQSEFICTSQQLTGNSKIGEISLVSKCSVVEIDQEEQYQVEHINFDCNYCGETPIKGYRYNCQICDDYDLCTNCYRLGYHQHEFIIIKQPIKIKKRQGSIQCKKTIIDNIRKSQKIK